MKTDYLNKGGFIALSLASGVWLSTGQAATWESVHANNRSREAEHHDVRAPVSRPAAPVHHDVRVAPQGHTDIGRAREAENRERDHWRSGVAEDHHHAAYWWGFHPGIFVPALPHGYISVAVGGVPYDYYQGVYYQPGPSGYVVAPPPIGAIVPELPPEPETIVVGNTVFYYAGGAFYVQQPNGFLVVQPPIGVSVAVLPPGAVPVNINGMTYYSANGAYFLPSIQNGATVYTTVRA